MGTELLVAQLIQVGIAALEAVLKAREIEARQDLNDEEKAKLIQSDLEAMRKRLADASDRIRS